MLPSCTSAATADVTNHFLETRGSYSTQTHNHNEYDLERESKTTALAVVKDFVVSYAMCAESA